MVDRRKLSPARAHTLSTKAGWKSFAVEREERRPLLCGHGPRRANVVTLLVVHGFLFRLFDFSSSSSSAAAAAAAAASSIFFLVFFIGSKLKRQIVRTW